MPPYNERQKSSPCSGESCFVLSEFVRRNGELHCYETNEADAVGSVIGSCYSGFTWSAGKRSVIMITAKDYAAAAILECSAVILEFKRSFQCSVNDRGV